MKNTFITILIIMLVVALLFIIPLLVTSQKVEKVSQLDIETLTSNFVDEIRITGKLTEDRYNKFLKSLSLTENTYDVNMEFKILDKNPDKSSTQMKNDKIGENVYHSIYTTQIEDTLQDENQKNTYFLKEGDMISVTIRNTNLTLGHQIKDFAYKLAGNDTYNIVATKSAMIVGNGDADIIL